MFIKMTQFVPTMVEIEEKHGNKQIFKCPLFHISIHQIIQSFSYRLSGPTDL